MSSCASVCCAACGIARYTRIAAGCIWQTACTRLPLCAGIWRLVLNNSLKVSGCLPGGCQLTALSSHAPAWAPAAAVVANRPYAHAAVGRSGTRGDWRSQAAAGHSLPSQVKEIWFLRQLTREEKKHRVRRPGTGRRRCCCCGSAAAEMLLLGGEEGLSPPWALGVCHCGH